MTSSGEIASTSVLSESSQCLIFPYTPAASRLKTFPVFCPKRQIQTIKRNAVFVVKITCKAIDCGAGLIHNIRAQLYPFISPAPRGCVPSGAPLLPAPQKRPHGSEPSSTAAGVLPGSAAPKCLNAPPSTRAAAVKPAAPVPA